jgi:formylmethanofuran dehydrogenase subunit E-like metal-binding protein
MEAAKIKFRRQKNFGEPVQETSRSTELKATAWRIKKMAENSKPVYTGLKRYDQLNNAMRKEAASQI